MTNPAQTAASRRGTMRTWLRLSGMLPVLVLLCIGFELASGRFLSVGNLSIVMQQAESVIKKEPTVNVLVSAANLPVGSRLNDKSMRWMA